MNLVTALMVNFSLEQAGKDKQAEEQAQSQAKAEVIGILERAFGELDTSRSGRINLHEMLEAPEELRMLICQVADVDTNALNLADIFRTLDFDNTGYLKINEFCQGLLMLHDRKALESYFVNEALFDGPPKAEASPEERGGCVPRFFTGLLSPVLAEVANVFAAVL
eukprot:CAMPEP_0171079118 /NCGR_PEP_ID=MMETSP0766_2-20121228/15057_1 /TAXON_ID=439317 /ORGANISM="Gambierdiscus australes, Strain CAWD 149" /LENGTH=165 /DNA_ID=CAMNT_0011536285 /DNA_START=93 /DNA_END=586 /DNA_ORIENTATION=-